MTVAKWIHKKCGGEIEISTLDVPIGVEAWAVCKKCGKRWLLGKAFNMLGIPMILPNLNDDWDEIEIMEEGDGNTIEKERDERE